MAILTWQNVSAPTGSGAGDMISTANDAFAAAMDGLQAASDRARANRRAAYSTQALLGLTGVTDPNAVAAYAQGLNAKDLTPEALAIIQAQPGMLLDRKSKELGIQDLEADFTWQQDARAGDLAGSQRALEARHMAGTTGDIMALDDMQRGLDGHAQRTLLGQFGSVLDDRNTHLGYTKESFAHNQNVVDYDTDNLARNIIQNNLRPAALTKDQAVHLLDQMPDLDPRVREKVYAKLQNTEDSFFQSQDMLAPQSTLRGNQTLLDEFTANQRSAMALGETVEADLAARPENIYLDNLESLDSFTKNPENKGQGLAGHLEKIGVTSPGFGWDGENQDIERVRNLMMKPENGGIMVRPEEVAAAGMTLARTSNIAFVDALKTGNDDQVVKLLKKMRDGGSMESIVTEREKRRGDVAMLNDYSTQIQQLDNMAALAASRNMPDEQKRIEDARNQLIAEQTAMINQIRGGNASTGSPAPADGAAATPTDSATAAATAQNQGESLAPSRPLYGSKGAPTTFDSAQAKQDFIQQYAASVAQGNATPERMESRVDMMVKDGEINKKQGEEILREAARQAETKKPVMINGQPQYPAVSGDGSYVTELPRRRWFGF